MAQRFLQAAAVGVAFPLSATHYIETARDGNARRRSEDATFKATLSGCRTLASRRVLLSNQLMLSLHDHFGVPTPRPDVHRSLGLGVHWAFTGKEQMRGEFTVDPATGNVIPITPGAVLRRENQRLQLSFLSGPEADKIQLLREQYGYRPESTEETGASRVAWEHAFAESVTAQVPKTREEKRLWVQVGYVTHELPELLGSVLPELGLGFDDLMGGRDTVDERRAFLVGFFDSMPSVQVAVDLKTALHFDNERPVKVNDLRDIDSMEFAIPYCHVVVADAATVDAARRMHVGDRYGTVVTGQLADVVAELPRLEALAAGLPDPSGWDLVGPGSGFHPQSVLHVGPRIGRRSAPSQKIIQIDKGQSEFRRDGSSERRLARNGGADDCDPLHSDHSRLPTT